MAPIPTWSIIESSDSYSGNIIDLVLSGGNESWEWIKQVILGEFDEDRDLSAILADMTISLVPGVIIVTSARDMVAIISRLSLHPERRKEIKEWVLLFSTVVPVAYPLIAAGIGAVAEGVGAIVTGGAAIETDGILGGIVRTVCLLLLRGAKKGEKLLAEIINFLQAHVAGNIYEFLKTIRFSDYVKPICDVIQATIKRLLSLAQSASETWLAYHPAYIILERYKHISEKLKAFETQYYALQTQLPTKISEAAIWLQQKLDEILKIDPPASGPMMATAGGGIDGYALRTASDAELVPAWPTNPLGVPPEVAMASRVEEDATRSASSAARDENVHIGDAHSSTATNDIKLASIDFEGHIFRCEIKYNKRGERRVVGGHSLLTDDIRIIPGTETAPNAQGVYRAKIEVADPDNPGNFIPKSNGGGFSTMFPKNWDENRIKREVSIAFDNKEEFLERGVRKWEGVTPSGVKVEGYLEPKITAYPLM